MSLLWLSLALLLAIGAALARLTGAADDSRATTALRATLGALASLVVVEAGLGACGWLSAGATALALGVTALGCGLLARRRPAPPRPASRAPVAPLEVACVAALLVLLGARTWAGLHKTTFLYDTLSYHLHVPATWIAAHRLRIVPAVFGDPSSAYAPSNLELWFVFLMAPLRSDALAGSGQLAFAALAVLAVVSAVREAGGGRAAGLAAALAFLLVPEIWQQAPTAMTDLGMAALLLAALPFVFRLGRGAAPGDVLAIAAALGLAVGTKYAALPLAVPFALAGGRAAGRTLRPRALAGATVIFLVTGGFWLVRNVLLTHNPWYPVATLGLPGVYDRAAMLTWVYHLPVAAPGALAEMLGAAGFGFVVLAGVALVWRRPRPAVWMVPALIAIFWLWIPYQESRFLFAAFGVAAVAIGRAAGDATTKPDWRVAAVLLAAAASAPSLERWLALTAGILGAGGAWVWHRSPAAGRRPLATAGGGALLLAGVVALTVGVQQARVRAPGYTVGTGLDAAWTWMRANVHDARVAYTGNNLAFPLAGRGLSNRVRYVNVSGAPDAQLHDFAQPGTRATTPEPAPYRDGARFDTWLHNLRAAQSEVLFVAALDEIVARNVAADDDGFPIERTWADAHPALFRLRYASPDARVYGIAPP